MGLINAVTKSTTRELETPFTSLVKVHKSNKKNATEKIEKTLRILGGKKK